MDHDLKDALWPLKLTMKEKLQAFGISEHAFKFYCEAFIQNWQCYMTMKDDKGWQVIKSKTGKFVKLDEHVVAYHLLGKFWVAGFAPPVPWYLCMDIDASEKLRYSWRVLKKIKKG